MSSRRQITVSGLQRVLQNLLAERVSIRDLPTILEGISEATAITRNLCAISEHVRARLARQISNANTNDIGYIPLSPCRPNGSRLLPKPSRAMARNGIWPWRRPKLQQFINAVRQTYDRNAPDGRVAGAVDQPRYSALCAFGHRALPARHRGAVAERDLPKGQN